MPIFFQNLGILCEFKETFFFVWQKLCPKFYTFSDFLFFDILLYVRRLHHGHVLLLGRCVLFFDQAKAFFLDVLDLYE